MASVWTNIGNLVGTIAGSLNSQEVSNLTTGIVNLRQPEVLGFLSSNGVDGIRESVLGLMIGIDSENRGRLAPAIQEKEFRRRPFGWRPGAYPGSTGADPVLDQGHPVVSTGTP